MMKNVFIGIFSVLALGVHAQIFINSNTEPTTQEEVNTSKEVYLEETETMIEMTEQAESQSSNNNHNSSATSSITDEDVPPNAEPGKCYARCWVEDTYKYVNETVIDQPRMVQKMKLPALYKTVYDTIVVTPATTKSYVVPAEYEYITEQVMITPSTTKWVKGKADAGCLSANPEDCQVMCLVEVPAVYKTVNKKVLKNKAYTREETIPMQYKVVTREIILEEERVVDVVTPATYKTVQKRVVDVKGGYQIWREILCGDDLTADKIIRIQEALKANGYDPGPMDDVFGPQTKAALIQYQKDFGLPVGNLNLETLESLGVD